MPKKDFRKHWFYAATLEKNGYFWTTAKGGMNRQDDYKFKILNLKYFNSSSITDNFIDICLGLAEKKQKQTLRFLVKSSLIIRDEDNCFFRK